MTIKDTGGLTQDSTRKDIDKDFIELIENGEVLLRLNLDQEVGLIATDNLYTSFEYDLTFDEICGKIVKKPSKLRFGDTSLRYEVNGHKFNVYATMRQIATIEIEDIPELDMRLHINGNDALVSDLMEVSSLVSGDLDTLFENKWRLSEIEATVILSREKQC